MSDASVADDFLTTDEVGAILRVTAIYLRQMRLTGRGPSYVKVGKLVRYRRGDVDAWIASRRVTSTSDAVAA